MKIPEISVILPVFNGEKYINESIESILNQTFKDFELIIVNDASTDKTENIINSYSDSRIKIIKNQENLGVVSSFQKGFNLSVGKYVARVDADDICFPEKLRKQYDYLENNPHISIVGTNIIRINDINTVIYGSTCNPSEPDIIKWTLFWGNCIANPTILAQREIFSEFGGYNEEDYLNDTKNGLDKITIDKYNLIVQMWIAQDYELWLRASCKYNLANLPEKLLYYRWHRQNISFVAENMQKLKADLIAYKYISVFLEEKVDLLIIQMLRFTSLEYNFFQAYSLLMEMYRKFIEVYNPSPEINIKIRQDICDRLMGIVRRDHKWLNKVKGIAYTLKFDFILTSEIIYQKIQKKIRDKNHLS